MPLEPAPESPWNTDDQPLFGTYAGECLTLPFSSRFGRLERLRGLKRWQWFGVMSADVALAVAIVRTGYAGNVFAWVFDRAAGEFLEDLTRLAVLPTVYVSETTATDGRIARYRGLGEELEIQRNGSRWTLAGRFGDTRFDVTLDEGSPPSTAICPSSTAFEGAAHVTRKQADASASGRVRTGTKVFEIDGAHGFLDYSFGVQTGETIWRWAIGAGETSSGATVGFNLVASFNDGLENVAWIDGEPRFVGEVEFDVPDDFRERWRVRGDGIELVLDPEAVRSQQLDLGLVASDYAQPLGTWTGTIAGHEVRAAGVAEHHRSVW